MVSGVELADVFFRYRHMEFVFSHGAPLESVLDAVRREDGRGPPGRMALDVDGHRVHGDVGGRRLHVHGKRRRIAPQPLRPDAEAVDGPGERTLQLGAFGVLALGS